MDLDAVAERLQARVYKKTYADPAKRHQIVGSSVFGPHGRASWAIRSASEAIDGQAPRRTAVERILRRPAPDVPPLATRAEHETAWMDRRLRRLRLSGAEVLQVGETWKRRDRKGRLVAVESKVELVQARVRAGERAAVEAARKDAARLGVKAPARRRTDWNGIDPRVYETYRRNVAMHTSRIAHDALVDEWRDAAFDRLAQRGWGWIRVHEAGACGACLALCDGVVHSPTDRTFYRHTRCRCIPQAVRDGAKRPKTGREYFDSLTHKEQNALFAGRGGAAKAQALRDGTAQLSDLLQVDTSRADRTDYVIGEAPLAGLVPRATP